MKRLRLKLPPGRQIAFYHCISRVVDRRKCLGALEKEKFVQIMREYEEFCEVRVLTFCIMSNHFHILVEVPRRPEVLPSAEELLRKLDKLTCMVGYGWVRQRLEALEGTQNREARERFLESFYVRMWDVSWFIRLVKQRFSAWYNKRNERKGTLWEERFRSVLVDAAGDALATIAAYIDLNPVRARLTKDPSQYRWSGFGEAMAGKRLSRRGIQCIATALNNGTEEGFIRSIELYRRYIYLEGDERRAGTDSLGQARRGSLSADEVDKVSSHDSRLPVQAYVRRRVRYFCDGAVFGSRQFVDDVFRDLRERFGKTRKDGARRMKGMKDPLFVLRNLQKDVFDEEVPRS